MAFRPNTRRVFATWARAAEIARTWAWQTGRKHRIRRVRHVWRVERTDRRTGPFPPPVGRYIGEATMTIRMETRR